MLVFLPLEQWRCSVNGVSFTILAIPHFYQLQYEIYRKAVHLVQCRLRCINNFSACLEKKGYSWRFLHSSENYTTINSQLKVSHIPSYKLKYVCNYIVPVSVMPFRVTRVLPNSKVLYAAHEKGQFNSKIKTIDSCCWLLVRSMQYV